MEDITKYKNNLLINLKEIIADDKRASEFQSLGQYRKMLIDMINLNITPCEGNQPNSENANCAIFDVSKMLPDLERCKNAADSYADPDGTGQYGLVRKSFNDGINWALNFIIKQK